MGSSYPVLPAAAILALGLAGCSAHPAIAASSSPAPSLGGGAVSAAQSPASPPPAAPSPASPSSPPSVPSPDGRLAYADPAATMREMWLQVRKPPPERVLMKSTDIQAFVADWGFSDHALTVAVSTDGSASLYTSLGGGKLGVGAAPAVREAIVRLLLRVEQDRALLSRVYEPLPALIPGQIRFILVTDEALFTASVLVDLLGYPHRLFPMAMQVKAVMSAMMELKFPNP